MNRTPHRRRRAGALVLALQLLLATLVVAPASASSHTTTDRVRALLEAEANNTGTVGLLLREVDGGTLASHNPTFGFEPASTLKALTHFEMMRRIQLGVQLDGEPLALDRSFEFLALPQSFENGFYDPSIAVCPTGASEPVTTTLSTVLQTMMVNSDNTTTEFVRDLLWPGDIGLAATRLVVQASAAAFGMTSTEWNHVIGCVGTPNQLTLTDITTLYERVATTALDAPTRDAAFGLMPRIPLQAIINQEAEELGLNPNGTLVTSFRDQVRSAFKAGSYGRNYTGELRYYHSSAGWASIPSRNLVTCVPEQREYVFGTFIHGSEVEPATTHGRELYRELIRAALESELACTADLVHVDLEVVDPPTTIDVNTPTPITLRHTVRNLGPATVDALVATELTSGNAACDVTLPLTIGVQQLAPDSPITRDVTATVTCSQPGSRSLSFRGRIGPLPDAVTDPNPNNNTTVRQVTLSVVARADLAVVEHDLSELDAAGLGDFLVGSSTWFDAPATITNNGDTLVPGLYTDPVDAWLDHTIEVPAGLTAAVEVTDDEAPAEIVVAPAGEAPETLTDQPVGTIVEVTGPATIAVRSPQNQLAIDEQREIATRFALGCDAPGDHDLRLEVRVSPRSEFVLDPDPSNDAIVSARTVTCVTPVQPNIRPGNADNEVTPGASQAVPVAALTTVAGEYDLPLAFDATTIDAASVRFGTKPVLAVGGGAGPVTTAGVFRDSFELDDTTRDGDRDLQAAFRPTSATGIDATSMEACITGRYLDGDAWYLFLGCDRVTTQPSG